MSLGNRPLPLAEHLNIEGVNSQGYEFQTIHQAVSPAKSQFRIFDAIRHAIFLKSGGERNLGGFNPYRAAIDYPSHCQIYRPHLH
jgi:hypothetical protein